MSCTNNSLQGIVACVLCCTTEEIVRGSSGRKGMMIGTCLWNNFRATISLIVKYPTGKSEAIRVGRLDQVFGEPSNHKVQ